MLKVCLDCLAGNRVENDAYGTTVNGGNFRTPWPTSQLQNGIMLRLPRELSLGDKINIKGIRSHDRESFVVNLKNGINTPDDQNIVCQFEADYNMEQIILHIVQNGQKHKTIFDDGPSAYFKDQYFDLSFEWRLYEDTSLFDVYAGMSLLGSVEFDYNLRDITYITLSPGTVKVNELNFLFSNTI